MIDASESFEYDLLDLAQSSAQMIRNSFEGWTSSLGDNVLDKAKAATPGDVSCGF